MLRAGWVAVVAMLAVAGRAEGQGLPVRMTITASATVVPLPAAQTVTLDSAQALAEGAARLAVRLPPADSAAAAERRRVRRVVLSYPGT